MNAQSIPVVAMASISLYVGCYHLLIYFRRRQHREDLTFALLCLVTCLYNVFCVGLYNSSTIAEGVQWQRAQLIALALFTTAFLWFAADYMHQRPGPVVYAFTAFYLLAIIIQLVDRSSLTWVFDQPSIKEIVLSSDFKIVYYEATFGPFTTVQSLMGLVASTYILVSGIRFYQRGFKREARPLLVAMGLMYVAALNDTAVANGLYQFVYVIEYGYMAMILLMAYSLSNTIVEAAMAKEALRESEQKYRSFVEESSEGFVLTDKEGRIVEWNRAQEHITGLRREEVIGTPLWDTQLRVVVPERRNEASASIARTIIQEALQTGESASFGLATEVEICQPDGRRVLVEQAAFPIKFEQGYRLGSVVRDVTARKEAEAALAHERDLLQTLMDNLPDAIYFKDRASQFTRINRAQAQILGLATPDAAIGKTDFDFFPTDLCQMYFQEEQQLMQAGTLVLDRLEFNPAPDDQPRWLAATKAAIRDAAGNVVGMVGVSRDVTDRVLAQERADTTSRSLRAVIEIAHELIGCTDLDPLCRRAVELARDKLNIERCGLFLLDKAGILHGTYGTDLQRETTDERTLQLSPAQRIDFDVAPEQLWTIFESEHAYHANLKRTIVGIGWTGSTLIRTRERTIGVMYNDTAISHAPVNEAQQEVLAVYCSLLGSLIELKRTEETLQMFQYTVDRASDAVQWLNREGGFEYVNDQACRSLGYSREELLHLRLWDIDPIYPKERWDTNWEGYQVDRRGGWENVETLHRRKDGSVFPVELSSNHLWFGDRELHIAVVRDITERKQAEEALRQSRNLLQVVLDTIPVRVFWKDRDLRYLGCNRPFALDAGLPSPEEMIGKDDYQMGWRDQADLYRGDDRQVLESGQPRLDYEEPQTTPDGRQIWLRTNKVPLQDADGTVWGVLGTYEDITERKRVEQTLRLRLRLTEFAAAHSLEELLQKTLDEVGELTNSPIGFYHFVEADQRTLSLQAWSTRTLAEFCQAEGKGLHYPIDQAGVWTDCVRERRPVIHNDYPSLLHRQGLPEGHAQVMRELVVPILRGDRIVAILGVGNKAQAYTDKDIEVVSYVADLAWEITERKQAEEALRESEEKYRRLVEVSPVAMWINQDGIITYMNPAALHILGAIDLQQVVGRAALDFIHPDYHTSVIERISQMVDREQIVPLLEEKYVRLDGGVVDVEVTATPFSTSGGRAMQVLFQDITERKRAEAERERLIAELENKNAELERFTYTASHDLKSPLVTIRGFLGFLEKDIVAGDVDQLRADIARIRNAADRMQRLLNELLELSRIGRLMNPPETVSLVAIAQEAIELVQGRIEAGGVQIEVQPDLPVVQGDRARLVEVMQNLIDNACKFRGDQPAPRVTIGRRGTDQDGKPIVFVRDNGLGIDPQYHEKIFGLFDKLDPQAEGTGIGLALVKRIIEVHGGRIWVESTGTQAGATFCFTLPVQLTA